MIPPVRGSDKRHARARRHCLQYACNIFPAVCNILCDVYNTVYALQHRCNTPVTRYPYAAGRVIESSQGKMRWRIATSGRMCSGQ